MAKNESTTMLDLLKVLAKDDPELMASVGADLGKTMLETLDEFYDGDEEKVFKHLCAMLTRGVMDFVKPNKKERTEQAGMMMLTAWWPIFEGLVEWTKRGEAFYNLLQQREGLIFKNAFEAMGAENEGEDDEEDQEDEEDFVIQHLKEALGADNVEEETIYSDGNLNIKLGKIKVNRKKGGKGGKKCGCKDKCKRSCNKKSCDCDDD